MSQPMTDRLVRWFLLAATIVTFALAMIRYDGPARGYWDTYITAPAMFMNATPVRFHLADGQPAFACNLKGTLPDDLVDKNDFGIITKDQRIGPAISAAPMFAFFGLLGFRLLFALTVALIVPAAFLLCTRVATMLGQKGRRVAVSGLAAALLMANNPFSWAVDRLNANLFSMPLMLLVLWLLLDWRRTWPLLGLVFGALAGIRNEAICFVPAICLAILFDLHLDPPQEIAAQPDPPLPFSARFIRLVGVGALCVVAMGPVFYWKNFAFGHPLMHPSQYAHFHGFRPEFVHSLLGWQFSFNGLFNWPLHTELVRTPHFGYPTWLLFPLVTARAWGAAGVALAIVGAVRLVRSHRLLLAVLVVWALPVYALFGPQENWEEVKMTFMLLAWPPLAPLFAVGFADLASRPTGLRLGPAVAVTVAVMLAVNLLAAVHAPADQRWYVRFPNADKTKNPGAQRGLDPAERNEWRYFQSYETEEEIARERQKLGAALPWPAPYLPVSFAPRKALATMVWEADNRDLAVLEIWGYIYGTRRWPAGKSVDAPG